MGLESTFLYHEDSYFRGKHEIAIEQSWRNNKILFKMSSQLKYNVLQNGEALDHYVIK
jgi:hypothetical protein